VKSAHCCGRCLLPDSLGRCSQMGVVMNKEDKQTIENNLSWLLQRLAEMRQQIEMLMDYLEGRGDE